MKNEATPRTFWDRTWGRFLKHQGMVAPSAKLVQLLVPLVPRNSVVVDLGCGEGRNTLYLNRIGFKGIGTDLSFKAVKILKNNLFEEEVKGFGLVSDANWLPFRNDSVNAIVAHHLFDHLPAEDFSKSLDEAYRVLCLGGVILMTMGSFSEVGTDSSRKNNDGAIVFTKGPQKGMLLRPYSDQDLEKISRSGWIVVKDELTPRKSKILILQKPSLAN